MIDSLDSLTFSLHANRSGFALLLGSGISRAAKISTGWEIVLDLVRRLAILRGESAEPDPEAWYRTLMGEDPEYSKLLAVSAAPAWTTTVHSTSSSAGFHSSFGTGRP